MNIFRKFKRNKKTTVIPAEQELTSNKHNISIQRELTAKEQQFLKMIEGGKSTYQLRSKFSNPIALAEQLQDKGYNVEISDLDGSEYLITYGG